MSKRFDSLTKAEQRIAIIEDVLSQIDAGRYIPHGNVWIAFSYDEIKEIDGDVQLRTAFKKEQLTDCDVCANGSLLMSLILFKNDFKVGDLPNGTSLYYAIRTSWQANAKIEVTSVGKRLHKYFTPKQLRLIEIAFEMGEGFFKVDATSVKERKAVSFGETYHSHSERLIAIMENMLKNDGIFKP
jgi:hypothetical protein